MLPTRFSFAPILLWTFLPETVTAFRPHVQQSLLNVHPTGTISSVQSTNTALHLHTSSSFFDDIFLLSDAFSDPKGTAVAAASAAAGVPDVSSAFNLNVGETLKNVAFGITALIFAFVALTSLAAAILIPAGAEQLEKECKMLIPDTWDQYIAKLEEGQEMKDRPDLMFELGLLLNKCRADRLKVVCVDAQLGPELWDKYQGMLEPEQELQDRPELIVALGTEVAQRAGQVLKENTNICPPEIWEKYEQQTGDSPLIENLIEMDQMAQELGYADLVEATTACLVNDSDLLPSKEEGDAREDATTISGITEIRRNTDQWDDEDE